MADYSTVTVEKIGLNAVSGRCRHISRDYNKFDEALRAYRELQTQYGAAMSALGLESENFKGLSRQERKSYNEKLAGMAAENYVRHSIEKERLEGEIERLRGQIERQKVDIQNAKNATVETKMRLERTKKSAQERKNEYERYLESILNTYGRRGDWGENEIATRSNPFRPGVRNRKMNGILK